MRLSTLEVVRSIKTGGNPYSIAITNDGDRNDRDERVFVTRLFGELIDPARPDGFDDAKQGVVDSFRVGDAVDGNAQVAQLAAQAPGIRLRCGSTRLLSVSTPARRCRTPAPGRVLQQRR